MARAEPRETATERAYSYTKTRLLDGRFPGGELLSEGDVAASVGLSRTPVREAFLRLEAEGFLRLYPKRGALVVPVSAAEVEDVMETRMLVERFAIEKVGRAPPDLLARLTAEIDRQERFAARNDARAFTDSDREFHHLLVVAAGNTLLVQLHDTLRDRQSRMGLVALAAGGDGDRMREIGAEHRGLVEALSTGAQNAGELMRAHLQGTLELLRGRRA